MKALPILIERQIFADHQQIFSEYESAFRSRIQPSGKRTANSAESIERDFTDHSLYRVGIDNGQPGGSNDAGLLESTRPVIPVIGCDHLIEPSDRLPKLGRDHANEPIAIATGYFPQHQRRSQFSRQEIRLGKTEQDNLPFAYH